MQRIAIPPEFIMFRKRTGLRRLVRMVSCNRQPSHEEPLASRQNVHPIQDVRNSGRLIHSKAGVVITSDIARIRERIESAVADDGLHAEVRKASRVEHPSSIDRKSV